MRVGKVRLCVVAVAGTQQQMPQCSQVSNRLNAAHGNCMKVWAHKQEDAATNEFASLGSLETVPLGGGSLPEVGVSLAEVRTPGYVRCSGDAGAWGYAKVRTPGYTERGAQGGTYAGVRTLGYVRWHPWASSGHHLANIWASTGHNLGASRAVWAPTSFASLL